MAADTWRGASTRVPHRTDAGGFTERRYSPVDLFEIATIGGARALGLDADIGSIEIGKSADLAVLELRRPHALGPDDVYTQLVYSARASDVRHVFVGGKAVVADGVLLAFNEADALADAVRQRSLLLKRAQLASP